MPVILRKRDITLKHVWPNVCDTDPRTTPAFGTTARSAVQVDDHGTIEHPAATDASKDSLLRDSQPDGAGMRTTGIDSASVTNGLQDIDSEPAPSCINDLPGCGSATEHSQATVSGRKRARAIDDVEFGGSARNIKSNIISATENQKNNNANDANANKKALIVCNGVEVPMRYWSRRSCLWHRFASRLDDTGAVVSNVCMDEEGWYSVTPQTLADYIATRAARMIADAPKCEVPPALLDLFGGCGGNAIAFARSPIAVTVSADCSLQRLKMTQRNAHVYEVPMFPNTAAHSSILEDADADYRVQPRLILLHADAGELLCRLLSASKSQPPTATKSTHASCSCPSSVILTLDNCRMWLVEDMPGVRVAFTCPCGAITTCVHVAGVFSAPPWGGPAYAGSRFDLDAGTAITSPAAPALAATLGTTIALTDTGRLPGSLLLRSVARAVPHHMHYLPRNTAWKDLKRMLNRHADAETTTGGSALHAEAETCYLEGMRNACALLLTVSTGIGSIASEDDA